MYPEHRVLKIALSSIRTMFEKQSMLYEMQVVLVWFIGPPMFGSLVIRFY
jgi:hypothetical protein